MLPIPPHPQNRVNLKTTMLFYHNGFALSSTKIEFLSVKSDMTACYAYFDLEPFLSSSRKVASISAIFKASAKGNILRALPTVLLLSSPENPM